MLDLASSLSRLPEMRRPAPWAGYEYVKGWAVFGLPFDSGHVLALRVMPESSIAPYRSLYHRDPQGNWELHVDGPKVCACTRYYGSACSLTGHTRIQLEWTGPATLRVTLNQPQLDWTLRASSDRRLDLINAVNAMLPLSSWRSSLLLRARERVAKAIGLGEIRLSGTAPSGDLETLIPEQIYFIEESSAALDGVDLGRPAHLRENPKLGTMRLPTRGILVRGQGMWQIRGTVQTP
jgi:hypothetical protein